ncbi:MAG TPA: M24 family metallopeptidase [Chloroflexota bacterium]|nr:M24 family metallopeptidase [Chloroflexota bacterium]
MRASATESALPSFSTAERDRRWARVRQLMVENGIDVLLAPPNTGSNDKYQADARYLTQFGLNGEQVACIFPLNGKVIGFGGPSTRMIPRWMEDVRTPRRAFNDAIVGALKEIGADGATIGICGLKAGVISLMRAPDGVVGANLMDAIRREFPRARIVSATDVIGEARITKSAEEIDFLTKATELAEAALEALLRVARPGVTENACNAAMMAAEIERDGTLPFLIAWDSGPIGHLSGRLTQPARRVLNDGDVILQEIEGRWAGYTAQIDQSTFVGRVPDACRDAWKVAVESFERAVAAMRPGVTYGQLIEVCAATPRVSGWGARVVLHGRGLGDEGPLITTPPYPPGILERPLQEGNVFVIKPAVERATDEGSVARFGDVVAVTATGARRLGTRSQEFAHYNVGV